MIINEPSTQKPKPIIIELPHDILKNNDRNYISKNILPESEKSNKDTQLHRCESDSKNQGIVNSISLKIENAHVVNKSKFSADLQLKKEESISHQNSYLGEINISSKEILSILSMKDNSINISPEIPIREEKKDIERKIETKKLSILEKDHALNEKSKKKFNPEIFVQLKTGTILTHYNMGQLLGEG